MSDQSKVALVTGATRGIGKAVLTRLVREGYYVVGSATSDKGTAQITETIQSLNGKGHGVILNVADPASIESVLSSLEKSCGMPDVLVNNAGITEDDLLMRMNEEKWLAVINTNLTSVYRLSKACVRPMMKKRWGRIISIGSVVGVMGNAGQTNYCAAKAGVLGFSKALAREIGSRGITVNVVAPGFIQTDMTDALSDELKAQLVQQIPLGKIGQGADIAAAVAFLASEDAGYMTGETLHVNGGMYMV
jgi:3-oxoacyl-[acyl-carrier protein] reductase